MYVQNMDIFYDVNSISLNEFIQGVVTNFLKTYKKTPDFEGTV